MADEQDAQPFDATDPAAENNQRRDEKRREREDADVLRMIMMKPQGRSWLYRFLESCHIYGSTFAEEQTHVSAFRQGEENVGKRLMLAAQAASVDLYMSMIKQAQAEAQSQEETRRKEQRNREREEAPPKPEELVADLPPPAGFPGGPPLPKKK